MYYRCLIGLVSLFITFLYSVVFKRFFYNTAAILFYLNCVKKKCIYDVCTMQTIVTFYFKIENLFK